MARKDKNDSQVYRYLLNLTYSNTWENYTDNKEINEVLSHASKNNKGNSGYPDAIYVNEEKKLLIIAEVKPSIAQHISQSGKEDAEKFAVDGVLHYLKFFLKDNLKTQQLNSYFSLWKVVGLAISGDIEDDYNHRISCFLIVNHMITEQKGSHEILNETDYISLFENIDEEEIITSISTSSKKINKWLRSVDSQKRPVLLSALMICLFEVEGTRNDFKNGYNSWAPDMIVGNVAKTVKKILLSEKLPEDKINILLAELAFLEHDQDLNTEDILKDILNELNNTVIPLFRKKSNYDIIGKFYEEFLRYAGIANVKKGIVLTPKHITSLFTELIDIRVNDVFLDPACGTGAFLIAAMNKLEEVINSSSMSNKEKRISDLKSKQLIGFEKNPTMYSLAISNMLFRGDGKSQIFYDDFFTTQADKDLQDLAKKEIMPTIGFVNPPYGGKDNKDNPTKKEIQFLTRMLDRVSRYGIIIAPLSTYFKDDIIRNNILKKHTLKYVINMPKDLFMPNAATNTAIAVFETNKPQGEQRVVFYNLKDDGFVLSKSKGRTDVYNKWGKIQEKVLRKINSPDKYEDGLELVQTKIKDGDEWLIQAHAKTDYSHLNENIFLQGIKEYMVFTAKQEMNLLENDIDEITLLEIVSEFYADVSNDEG